MFHPAYDVPRHAPLPTCVDKQHLSPAVPEISMIFNNAPHNPEKLNPAIKEHAPRFHMQHKPLNHFDMQKQVRFQSPPQEKQFTVFGNKSALPDKAKVFPSSLAPQNKTNKFADVYMANVPNRHLDLSMIDNFVGNRPAVAGFSGQQKNDLFTNLKCNNKEISHNATQEQNETLGVRNIHSYRGNESGGFLSNNENSFTTVNENINRERAVAKMCADLELRKNSADEPTVKDLLKIIQQQNEQLLILQKQVSQLIELQANQQIEKQRPLTAPHVTDYYCQRQTNVFGDVLTTEKRDEFNKPQDKGPLSKFAIGVTTSFEVSVRRQQNSAELRNKFKNCTEQDGKIQEITTDASNVGKTTQTDGEVFKSMGESLFLSEQLPVREECPSPENSVHVDMHDYSSDDTDDDSSCSSSNIDWTLYNNIMEQVNQILRKAQNGDAGKYKDETMKKVMEATVKHLKSVGIDLTDANNGNNFQMRTPEATKNYSPTEISFAVKQLLMKYLPPEHLAKAVTTNSSNGSSENSEEMSDLIKKRPEFSFATLQYMKKYNLIRTERKPEANKMPKPNTNLCPKILDITALKQQPKLL